MHRVPTARPSAGDEVSRRPQHLGIELVPDHHAIEGVELSHRGLEIAAAQPMEVELLAALDTDVQTELTTTGGSQDIPTSPTTGMLAAHREKEHRGVEEDRPHRGESLSSRWSA